MIMGPSGIAFSLVTCAHLWLWALLQSPFYTKHLYFYSKVCLITRLQAHFGVFSWFCKKMLPVLGREHTFAPLPSLGGGLNSPPNAYRELFLSTWQAISRPIILLPARAGSIIPIFDQKRTKKSYSVFLLFPSLKISVQIFDFQIMSQKNRFLPWCGAHFWKACARTQLPTSRIYPHLEGFKLASWDTPVAHQILAGNSISVT